jgi:hypothetical protein
MSRDGYELKRPIVHRIFGEGSGFGVHPLGVRARDGDTLSNSIKMWEWPISSFPKSPTHMLPSHPRDRFFSLRALVLLTATDR